MLAARLRKAPLAADVIVASSVRRIKMTIAALISAVLMFDARYLIQLNGF